MEILSLGEKIKRIRKENDLTLKDLAGERITPGQISLVESGKSNPSMDLLEYLANSLNTSVEYLMESEETQAEKICTFYENLGEAHILNYEWVQAEQYIEESMYYAEKYNLQYNKARNLILKASIFTAKNEMVLAQEYYLSANVIFIKQNRFEEVIETFLKLGIVTLKLNAYYSSCSYFQQAERVYEDNNIGNDFILGQIYFYLSQIYFELEMIDKSINYAYLAKEKYKQLDDKNGYARSLLILAKEYGKKDDLNNAIKYSKQAMEIFKEIKDYSNLSQIENDLGKLFYEFDNLEESFIHLNKARQMREYKEKPKLISTLCSICENNIKLKNVNECNVILQDIMNNLEFGNDEDFIRYYLLKYKVNIIENNLEESENNLILSLDYAKATGSHNYVAQISILLGKFYIDRGEDKKASLFLNEGVLKFKELGII